MPNGWLNVTHFRQETNYSCVAACVRMVLAHYGRIESEPDLCQLLGTTPFYGTRADAVRRVEIMGFEVENVSTVPELQAALAVNAPPIVFLRTGQLDYWSADAAHAVVLTGLEATAAFLNDPFFDAFPQQPSLASFQQAWAMTGHLASVIHVRS